ncbi:MAG: XRE family transcriptional regulator [Acholeplasmatales bacterium]|nr:MAG: XRE family transcriptional regulator [Acholeplasmatales bacterium]
MMTDNDTFDLQKVGDNLRKLRIAHHYTRADFAQILFDDSKPVAVLDAFEHGQVLIPLEQLVRVCNHFAIKLSDILVFREKYGHLSSHMI